MWPVTWSLDSFLCQQSLVLLCRHSKADNGSIWQNAGTFCRLKTLSGMTMLRAAGPWVQVQLGGPCRPPSCSYNCQCAVLHPAPSSPQQAKTITLGCPWVREAFVVNPQRQGTRGISFNFCLSITSNFSYETWNFYNHTSVKVCKKL